MFPLLMRMNFFCFNSNKKLGEELVVLSPDVDLGYCKALDGEPSKLSLMEEFKVLDSMRDYWNFQCL